MYEPLSRKRPETGDIYRHFKGSLYEVVCVARSVDTDKDLVIYKNADVDKGVIFARSLKTFLDSYPEGYQGYRFTEVHIRD